MPFEGGSIVCLPKAFQLWHGLLPGEIFSEPCWTRVVDMARIHATVEALIPAGSCLGQFDATDATRTGGTGWNGGLWSRTVRLALRRLLTDHGILRALEPSEIAPLIGKLTSCTW